MRRWHTVAVNDQPHTVIVTPTLVQIMIGVADNFVTNIHVGRSFNMAGAVPRLGADVPRWYGETVGFWDKDVLITWTSNVQGWMVHGSFEFSSKMQTIEIYTPNRDAKGNFVGLNHEAIFYDPEALVQPLRIVRNFVKQSGFEEGAPYMFIECNQTIFSQNGRAAPKSPGDVIEFEVPDMYGRPWAKVWEKYFEQGMERPKRATCSTSSSAPQRGVDADRAREGEVAVHDARADLLRRAQVQLVVRQRRGGVIDERPELDADAPVFVVDVERERVAADHAVVERAERVGVVARPADHAEDAVAHGAEHEVLSARAVAPHPQALELRGRDRLVRTGRLIAASSNRRSSADPTSRRGGRRAPRRSSTWACADHDAASTCRGSFGRSAFGETLSSSSAPTTRATTTVRDRTLPSGCRMSNRAPSAVNEPPSTNARFAGSLQSTAQ